MWSQRCCEGGERRSQLSWSTGSNGGVHIFRHSAHSHDPPHSLGLGLRVRERKLSPGAHHFARAAGYLLSEGVRRRWALGSTRIGDVEGPGKVPGSRSVIFFRQAKRYKRQEAVCDRFLWN